MIWSASLKAEIPEPCWFVLLILLPQSIIGSIFNLCSSFSHGNRNWFSAFWCFSRSSLKSRFSFIFCCRILDLIGFRLRNLSFSRPRRSDCIFVSLVRSLRTAAFVLLWRWLSFSFRSLLSRYMIWYLWLAFTSIELSFPMRNRFGWELLVCYFHL